MAPRRESPTLFDLTQAPDLSIERSILKRRGGDGPVCGVDEAGRGPLAGPVVTAAVVLDPARIPAGLNDSKKLDEATRERLFAEICALHVTALSVVSAARIDRLNIRGATLAGMAEAVRGLAVAPVHALIDGLDVPPGLLCPADAVVKGDARSLSIAAASIVAKVTRDRLMVRLAAVHPGYGFDIHKGYATPTHRAALARLGPCPHHRRSFEPVKSMLAGAGGMRADEDRLLV